ncbi:protein spaetzle [Hylaeus volcanicus]|uniref:protein spaetzle n=1 Tax=Hylaeus volcanicus TaxID=313075 RepID=UPI0023B7CD8B|nr:protein spaetzle [Hylaeus volcanicus]
MLALLKGTLLLLVYEAYGHRQQFSIAMTKLNPSEGVDRDSDRSPICEHPTFCEFIPNYPSELVRIALQNNPYIRFYTNGDELDTPLLPEDEPEEQPLCVSSEQIVFPKIALTKDKDWKYIINHENWTQSVRVETCIDEDKPCRVIEGFAEGYVTKCRQKYLHRQLWAVAENGSISRETFRFPASCCCHIEFQGDKFLKAYRH